MQFLLAVNHLWIWLKVKNSDWIGSDFFFCVRQWETEETGNLRDPNGSDGYGAWIVNGDIRQIMRN